MSKNEVVQYLIDNNELLFAQDKAWSDNLLSKAARLLPVDLDIIHPATGELAESDQHDATKGGYVAVHRGTVPDAAEPISKLVIRASNGIPRLKWRLHFDRGTKFDLFKDSQLTQYVFSDSTEFDSSQDVTLYFKGHEKSASVGVQSITLMALIDGQSYSTEKVYFTVVESQIFSEVRFWIREGWIPVPFHPINNPLANKIAGGDERDNSLNHTERIRVSQEVVIIPFKELDVSGDGTRGGSSASRPGTSTFYHKPTSVPFPSLPYSSSNPLIPYTTPIVSAAPSTSRMHIYKVTRTNDKISKIYFEGAASDPLVIGSFDIDWDIGVSVDATNPLQLKYKIDGWHDDYPAVEINMEPGIKGDLGVGGTSYTTSPQPYFWLHPLPSNVFALGNDTEVTISPAKTGDVK